MAAVHYLHPRVFKLNVGFMLNAGPATTRDSVFEFPAVRVSDDLALNYLTGPLRLSRTKEGVLVQADLRAGLDTECQRCLDPVSQDIPFKVEELFATNPAVAAAFYLSDDGILDLAPLLREEILIHSDKRILCKPDCKGLCPECGKNRNRETCTCDEDRIDPRFAALKDLLKSE
jgi:uncharacterized protein